MSNDHVTSTRKYPPLGKHPSSIYTDAFQQWKSIRTRLGIITQEYLEACVTLKETCAQPSPILSDARWLDPVLIAIDAEIPSIRSDERTLLEARKELSMTRNCSSSLVPISRLSTEILDHILGFVLSLNGCYVAKKLQSRPSEPAGDYDLRYGSVRSATLDIISSVSTRWRQVALNNFTFWSHLDINLSVDGAEDQGAVVTKTFVARAELWVSRSGNIPLTVHIFDHGYQDENNSPFYSVSRFLKKYIHRIAVLNLEVKDTYLVEVVLSGLLSREAFPRLLKTFICAFPKETDGQTARFIEPVYPTPRNDDPPSTSILNRFLLSLHTVHLINSLARWSSLTYTGLVDLRIWGQSFLQDQTPTLEQLAGVFRASPGLRILKLGGFRIRDLSRVVSMPQLQVELGYLEVLDLAWMGSSSLGVLLPIIVPGERRPMTMSAKIFHNSTNALGALRDFFERAQVVRLQMIGPHGWFPFFCLFFDCLPHVQVLVVEDRISRGSSYFDDPRQPAVRLLHELNHKPSDSPSVHYPGLDVLFLNGCFVETEWLKQFLCNHSVRELYLVGVPSYSYGYATIGRRLEGLQNPTETLREVVPCLKVVSEQAFRSASMSCFAW